MRSLPSERRGITKPKFQFIIYLSDFRTIERILKMEFILDVQYDAGSKSIDLIKGYNMDGCFL